MTTKRNANKRTLMTRIYSNSFRIGKEVLHRTKIAQPQEKVVAFILGCQRSGTTLMYRIFDKDVQTKIYHERSKLTSNDLEYKIRLNDLDSVRADLQKDRVPLIVLKPLVETQNALELLSYFPGSKGLWMYRHYQDVATSNLKQFGMDRGILDLEIIVENRQENWRAQHVPGHIRELVKEHYSPQMNPYDAAALFWYVRNNLYFEIELDKNPDVMIFRYQNLAVKPAEVTRAIYEFVGRPYPGDRLVSEVDTTSVRKGRKTKLSPLIEKLCEGMLARLDQAYESKPYYVGT